MICGDHTKNLLILIMSISPLIILKLKNDQSTEILTNNIEAVWAGIIQKTSNRQNFNEGTN